MCTTKRYFFQANGCRNIVDPQCWPDCRVTQSWRSQERVEQGSEQYDKACSTGVEILISHYRIGCSPATRASGEGSRASSLLGSWQPPDTAFAARAVNTRMAKEENPLENLLRRKMSGPKLGFQAMRLEQISACGALPRTRRTKRPVYKPCRIVVVIIRNANKTPRNYPIISRVADGSGNREIDAASPGRNHIVVGNSSITLARNSNHHVQCLKLPRNGVNH